MRRAGDHAGGYDIRTCSDEMVAQLEKLARNRRRLSTIKLDMAHIFGSAKVEGDDALIQVVRTRIGVFLRSGSAVDTVWKLLCAVIEKTAKMSADHAETLFDFLASASILGAFFMESSSGMQFDEQWHEALPRLRIGLKRMGFPDDVPTCALSPDSVFNATSYWRDWDKGNF